MRYSREGTTLPPFMLYESTTSHQMADPTRYPVGDARRKEEHLLSEGKNETSVSLASWPHATADSSTTR